jgi:hypothetical protein
MLCFYFYTPVFKMWRIIMSDCPSIRPFHMSRSNLRTTWPIHFKFHRVIGIDGLTVCILYGESFKIINSNNYAKFEVNWPRGSQFTAWYTKNRLQFWWIKSHNSGMKIRTFTIKYTDRKTINSNNSVKFEVNWPSGS